MIHTIEGLSNGDSKMELGKAHSDGPKGPVELSTTVWHWFRQRNIMVHLYNVVSIAVLRDAKYSSFVFLVEGEEYDRVELYIPERSGGTRLLGSSKARSIWILRSYQMILQPKMLGIAGRMGLSPSRICGGQHVFILLFGCLCVKLHVRQFRSPESG